MTLSNSSFILSICSDKHSKPAANNFFLQRAGLDLILEYFCGFGYFLICHLLLWKDNIKVASCIIMGYQCGKGKKVITIDRQTL